MTFDHTESNEIPIEVESDIIVARKVVRDLTKELGFGVTDVTRIVTAASELARNIYRFAGSGVMTSRFVGTGDRLGIELVFDDRGPGITDLEEAMEVGFTSGGGLGMGLPGAKRLMDEMEIHSTMGRGTTVTIRKWRRR